MGERLGLISSHTSSTILALAAQEYSKRHIEDQGQDAEYWQQADESMHSNTAWKLRLKLRAHPAIQQELERFAQCVMSDGETGLTYQRYARLQLCLYKALVEPFSEKDAYECAAQDWREDAKGHKVLDREALMGSLFEMCDVWTHTIDPAEYWAFLRTLFGCITGGDPPRLLPLSEISVCRELIDGLDLDSEAASGRLAAEIERGRSGEDGDGKDSAEIWRQISPSASPGTPPAKRCASTPRSSAAHSRTTALPTASVTLAEPPAVASASNPIGEEELTMRARTMANQALASRRASARAVTSSSSRLNRRPAACAIVPRDVAANLASAHMHCQPRLRHVLGQHKQWRFHPPAQVAAAASRLATTSAPRPLDDQHVSWCSNASSGHIGAEGRRTLQCHHEQVEVQQFRTEAISDVLAGVVASLESGSLAAGAAWVRCDSCQGRRPSPSRAPNTEGSSLPRANDSNASRPLLTSSSRPAPSGTQSPRSMHRYQMEDSHIMSMRAHHPFAVADVVAPSLYAPSYTSRVATPRSSSRPSSPAVHPWASTPSAPPWAAVSDLWQRATAVETNRRLGPFNDTGRLRPVTSRSHRTSRPPPHL